MEILTKCLLYTGISFHLPNKATVLDGYVLVMHENKNVLVFKEFMCDGTSGQQLSIAQEENSFLYYINIFSLSLNVF